MKRVYGQQCVRNNVSSFTRAFKLEHLSLIFFSFQALFLKLL